MSLRIYSLTLTAMVTNSAQQTIIDHLLFARHGVRPNEIRKGLHKGDVFLEEYKTLHIEGS